MEADGCGDGSNDRPLITLPGSEFVINAKAHEVRGKLDSIVCWRESCGGDSINSAAELDVTGGAVAQIDEKVFDLSRPILEKGNFDAGAYGPAKRCRALKGSSRWASPGLSAAGQAGLHIAKSGASSTINEDAVDRVTKAEARRAQPIGLGHTG